MKILQILPELNVGGVETGTVDFAKYLKQHNHQAIVVSNGGALVAKLDAMGVKHYQLPVHKKNLFTMISMVKKLRRIIENEGVDIVHARSRVPAWIAYFATRKTKASFITTCHGFYGNRWFSQVMGYPKLVIVPSDAVGRHMMEDYGVLRENIRLIPRSVDLDKFTFQKGEIVKKKSYVVAIVGRITPLKGHKYFIESMARIIRQMPNVKVWIVGAPPADKYMYKEELEILSSRLGIRDHVEFMGTHSDVAQLMAKVDVLVMSSIEPESFGRVIVEAQAVGVPVVATSVGGVVDIIDDGVTGLLVPPKDTESMANAGMRIFNNVELANQISKNARKKVEEQFTLDLMAARTVQVYEELRKLESILVVKLSSVGDVVLVTASLKALRQKFPQGKIYCLVGKASAKVLQNCPYLDGILIYDGNDKHKGWRRLLRLAGKLRKYRFDRIVDFQNNRISHALSFLLFPKESFGYDGKWGFLLTNRLKDRKSKLPPVEHQFKVLEMMGIPPTKDHELELWINDTDKSYVKELLDSEWMGNAKDIVGINLSASEKWSTKNWPIEFIAELCDKLSAKNIRVFLTGTEKDREKVRDLLAIAKSKPASFVGKTDILQLAALIKRCKVFVTPDSAPLHVAAAIGTPAIALFGPTDSVRHIPPAKKIYVFEKKPACAPCYSQTCKVTTHVCMRDISVTEVLSKIKQMMGEKG